MLATLLAAAAAAIPVDGRSPASANIQVQTSVGATLVAPADSEAGGQAGWVGGEAAVSLRRRLEGNAWIGIGLRLARLEFDMTPSVEMPRTWSGASVAVLSLPVSAPVADGSLWVSPWAGMSAADGADLADSVIGGGIATWTTRFGTGLELGAGGIVWQRFGETFAVPILAIRWEISPNWRLANPPPLGPSSPAGLEVSWTSPSRAWEVGLGAAYRTERFRLADGADGGSGGVGRWRSVPVWVKTTRRWGPLTLTAWGGAAVAGRIGEEEADGREHEARLDAAPLAAFAVSMRW